MSETTTDDFLGGRLQIQQPKDGYRAGIDPVLLASAVPARSGDQVLELGTGVGTALLCLMARVEGLIATGVERDEAMAGLARANLAANGMAGQIVTADLRDLPSELREISFDHVFANPPFFDRARGSAAPNDGRVSGRGHETPLAVWIEVALRRLKQKGTLTLIHRAESLPALLSALGDKTGGVHVLPLAARAGREAKLILLQATKGAKGAFRLLAPFTLHDGDAHAVDGDDYTNKTSKILRQGSPLSLREFTNR